MKIKAITVLCPNCDTVVTTSNFALSAMSNGNAAPILYLQFECPAPCYKTSLLTRIDSVDFSSSVTRHYGKESDV